MPSFFARAINRLTWLAEVLAEVGLAVLLLIVFHEVIVRYVFNSPTLYSVELSEYLLVWVVFMSIAWVLKEDRHVAVTFAVDMMPQKVRQGLRLVTSLLTMAFLGVLIWQGGRTARTAFLGDYHSSSLLNFPMWIPYILIPLGALFLSLQYIVNILEIIQSLKSKDPGIEKPVR
jgi:C4-dicarboxylate transporter DctQ subunit